MISFNLDAEKASSARQRAFDRKVSLTRGPGAPKGDISIWFRETSAPLEIASVFRRYDFDVNLLSH
jgi:hypothetical protein